MPFQILSPEGPLTLKELDQQAFDFWKTGEEFSDKWYASPVKPVKGQDIKDRLEYTKRKLVLNWFDVIGHAIHNAQADKWEIVEEEILRPYLKEFEPDTIMEHPAFEEDVRAFLNLIKYWKEKGYTPRYVIS